MFEYVCLIVTAIALLPCTRQLDFVVQIPEHSNHQDGVFKLNYTPGVGVPAPNTTIPAKELNDVIHFSQALAGTKYEFTLYYTNASLSTYMPAWQGFIYTPPDPPTNLNVTVPSRGTKAAAHVTWNPPESGDYSGFKIKVLSLSEAAPTRINTLHKNVTSYIIKELTPGGTYQVQLFTLLDTKESTAYISRNFTTKPSTPGKFIVWFRNETTLLVLWQPSYPASIFSHYKVSIDPADGPESVLYVLREGEPPGPAQAAFKGLVPGRAYNISVQTASEDEISNPTTAQYRTIPSRPTSLTYDRASLTPTSIKVFWEPPAGQCEFDKYQISVNVRKQSGASITPITRGRDEPTVTELNDGLEPGKTYSILVKTFSAKVSSWPATLNVTMKPLPVYDLRVTSRNQANNVIRLTWKVDNTSTQDAFKVTYLEVEALNGDTNTMHVTAEELELDSLLPGRNYSITVQAVSNQIESNETIVYQAMWPSSPVLKEHKPTEFGLNISWESDVNSKQEYYEVNVTRNDSSTDEEMMTFRPSVTEMTLTNLAPGAGYYIKVVAVSHGLKSEPHELFQAVYPHPPQNLTIEKTTVNSVVVRWEPPVRTTVFSEYSIKYHTEEDEKWVRLPSVGKSSTEAEIADMTSGERYIIQVNTVSFGVESIHPLQTNHTVYPNAVSNIARLIDTGNITLEFPHPEGRVEYYIVSWTPTTDVAATIAAETKTKNYTDTSQYAGSEKVRLLVDDLMPGVEYAFRLRTVSYNLISNFSHLTVRTMPLIQSAIVVIFNTPPTTSITIAYTPTYHSSSFFDKYEFKLSDPQIATREKSADDADRKVTFDNLTPGRLYNITMWTVSKDIRSHPQIRAERLYPESITYINASKVTDRSIQLRWDRPRGLYDEFVVEYLDAGETLLSNRTPHTDILLTGLKPYFNYTFTVTVRSGKDSSTMRDSIPYSASFQTEESLPKAVESFRPADVQPSEIELEWSMRKGDENGEIVRYVITYAVEGVPYYAAHNKEFKRTDTSGTVKNLSPGKTYVFRIRAETKVGAGEAVELRQRMPIAAPPRPTNQIVPTEVNKGAHTIQIRFRKNYFSEQNGPITMYTIIVAEDDSKNASGIEMPSWRDVQTYSVWPPYQVVEPYYPFRNASVEDFTVGAQDNCEAAVGYCNGRLKSGTTYRVKIRAFTAADKFTDTYYSFPIQTDYNNTPLLMGGMIVVLLLVVTLVPFGLYLKQKKRLRFKRGSHAGDGGRNDNMSLPESLMETSRPVRLENFAEHYRVMSADSDFRFSEEFEELKHVGRDQANTAADLPCNRPKNRFTNILPYDHSRFKLQPVDDEEGSDYVNANYVPGHNSPREFVVTQGPLHCTRDDFWRMCWESNSKAIVMLTRVVEKGREKCDHYWPYDTLPVYYGDISVTLLNETQYADWIVSEFLMYRGDQKRMIKHFHFTTWPDFGVPSPPQTLIRFVRTFRERIGPEQRPIVVHCSAGVGRSGTFIALDRILQEILHRDVVDIFGIVYAMRKERVWMVQTEQQYICIHQCLLAVLQGQEIPANLREIHHNQGYEDDEGIAESNI